VTITARYPGRCSECGGAIEPGQQIDWNRETGRTAHIECPKAQTPTPRPADLVRVYHDNSENGAVLRVRGQVLTVVGRGEVYVDDEGMTRSCESFPGYEGEWVGYTECRPATEDEVAALEARDAAARVRKEAGAKARMEAEAANAETEAGVNALLADMVCAGGYYSLPERVVRGEVVARWKTGMNFDCYLQVITIDGRTCYLSVLESWDDSRVTFYGPREIVEAVWDVYIAERNITPEVAREWLARHAGCVGHEMYEYAASE
jgi:hypothetical protein